MSPHPLLRDLQQLLGRVYDADSGQDVCDYVVTDPALLAALTNSESGRTVEEKLIVVEGDDALDLALYLDPALLARLGSTDPLRDLSPQNLGDFWTAVEGVSHFNYLAWNAGFDKAVTLLELEMQAEVDKYVATRALLADQPAADLGGPLLSRLFDDTELAPELDALEQDRYRNASALAARYCRALNRLFPGQSLEGDCLRELRRFYRAPQPRKVERIRSLNSN